MKRTFGCADIQADGPVYLDCNATAPVEPAVRDAVVSWITDELGNAGSRTHEFGVRAKRAVQVARGQVAAVVDASSEEVIFTSGATESNNIAILGLAAFGEEQGKRHIVSTAIEHKAVLEPLEVLESRGFEVTLISPGKDGVVPASAVKDTMRPDTLMVSVMHANNETGAIQPLMEIADAIEGHEAYFHVDAAQGYGKDLERLRSKRVDLISVSGHKVYAPSGIGALIARRRGFTRPPLQPLTFGGGQERGLRPGTLPVPLIVGLGLAAELAIEDAEKRRKVCLGIRKEALEAFGSLGIQLHSDPSQTLSHVLNFSIPGIDSEAVMVAVKDLAALSNGSACTSQSYSPSHVLEAMGLSKDEVSGAVRISWSHLTPNVDWNQLAFSVAELK